MQTADTASQDPQSLEEESSTAEQLPLVLYDYSKRTQKKKKIIVCCDGTWNSEHFKQPHTNVSRTARAIKPYFEPGPNDRDKRPCPQVVLYQHGIGTGTSQFARIKDAVLGRGIEQNICEAYQFICHNYSHEDDDEIYLFGFSRGAYTAQCVAQLIANIGLLSKAGLPYLSWIYDAWEEAMECESMEAAESLLKKKVFPSPTRRWIFRSKQESELTPLKLEEMDLPKEVQGKVTRLLYRNVKIEALAVWDNVKSLGLPRLSLSTLLDKLSLKRRFRLINFRLLYRNVKIKVLAVWDNVKSLGLPRLPFSTLLDKLSLKRRLRLINFRLLYRNVKIKVLAVWNNVKSLDLPRLPFSTLLDKLGLRGRLRLPRLPFSTLLDKLGLRDRLILVNSTLPSSVENAFHALALHEHRASFSPTVWRCKGRSKLVQCWFLGCHGDVGGGSAGTVVFAHITLVWMLSQLMESLTFDLSELQSTFGIPEQASIPEQDSIQTRAEVPTTKTTTQHQDRGEEQDGHNEIDDDGALGRATKDAAYPMSDSKKGWYRLGGSHWRYPRGQYWDAAGYPQAQFNDRMDAGNGDGGTHYIHWTVRMLREHPAVLPLSRLDRWRPTRFDQRQIFWSVPPSKDLPDFSIPEYPPTAQERDLTMQWAPTALKFLEKYSKAVPETGAGNLAFCLFYFWSNYDERARDMAQYLPGDFKEYSEDPTKLHDLVFFDGMPYTTTLSNRIRGR